MLDFAYTERDDPEVRARIARDIERIVDACRAADPSLHALVLTGGFSRGEGTFRDGAPINDYDLVAIRRRPGGRKRYQYVSHLLTDDLGIEVDIMPVWRARLPRVGRKLFWLDLRLGGRVLHGDERALARLRSFGPRDLDPGESARLLGNRAAGLILALPEPGQPADERQVALQSAKAILAAMDAQLLHQGLYAAKLRDRLAMTKDHPDHALFERAVTWKLADGEPASWDDARRALLAAVHATHAERHVDGWTERTFHLLRAKRLRATPSRDVRHAAWQLLRVAEYPTGPAPDAAETILAKLGATGGSRVKERFFAARALTLQ